MVVLPQLKTLDRVLSKAGIGSRTETRSWIGAGRIAVNGEVIQTPDHWVDLERDIVTLDGEPVKPAEPVYLVLYKPKGYLTTYTDPEGRKTVYHLIKEVPQYVVPVGRLDLDTSGLLILTNDTQFAERVMNPDNKIAKTYMVKAHGILEEEALERLRGGVDLEDGPTRPAEVVRIRDSKKDTFLDITITEGRNRQVRRMIEAVGSHVRKLVRTSIGPLTIGPLEIGKWRMLTRDEINGLVGEEWAGPETLASEVDEEVEAVEEAARPVTAAKAVEPAVGGMKPIRKPAAKKEEPKTPPVRDSRDSGPSTFRARRDTGDRPARREAGERPARWDSGERPPRRDSSERPPRRDPRDRGPVEGGEERRPVRPFGFGGKRDERDSGPGDGGGERRPPRPYGGKRDEGFGDRGGDRPARPFGFGGRRDARDSGPGDGGGERRPPRPYGRRDEGERPPRRDARDSGDERGGERRPPRPYGFGSRDSGPGDRGGERRPPRPYGRRDEGERPPRRDARDGGDERGGERRPPREYGGGRRDEGERPPRRYSRDGGDERGGERRGPFGFGGRRDAGDGEGRPPRSPRPYGGKRDDGERPPRRDARDSGPGERGERRPPRPFVRRAEGEGSAPTRKPYWKPEGGGKDTGGEGGGEKRPYRPKSGGPGGGKTFGGAKKAFGGKPSGAKKAFGGKKPFGAKGAGPKGRSGGPAKGGARKGAPRGGRGPKR